MKYYIIAGERSGDLHASNLIKSLVQNDSQASFRCVGGEEMENAGAVLYQHYKDIALMGFLEVFLKARKLMKSIDDTVNDVLQNQPDVLILVDFSGFNLRVAKKIKKLNNSIPIHYYISPKIWAWNQSRAYKIKKLVDSMMVIMPFEKVFYAKFDFEVDYVGNPVVDAITAFKQDSDFLANNHLPCEKKIIAVLPGSRKQEVENMLELMIGIHHFCPDFHFVVCAVNNLPKELYTKYSANNISFVWDKSYDVLAVAHSALVTSGTATLETALFNVPQVVCYKTSGITYFIAKLLIKVKYISLVNLIMDKQIVKELIQNDLTIDNLHKELMHISDPTKAREVLLEEYTKMGKLLGGAGASEKAAQVILKKLKNKSIGFKDRQ